jgi:hypothetical protein
MNIRYRDNPIAIQERSSTNLKLGFDLFTFGVGQALARVGLATADLGLNTMFAGKDAFDTYRDNHVFSHLQQNYVASVASNRNWSLPMMNFGGSNYGAALSNVFSTSVQARREAASGYNASTGASGSGGGVHQEPIASG